LCRRPVIKKAAVRAAIRSIRIAADQAAPVDDPLVVKLREYARWMDRYYDPAMQNDDGAERISDKTYAIEQEIFAIKAASLEASAILIGFALKELAEADGTRQANSHVNAARKYIRSALAPLPAMPRDIQASLRLWRL
jgi:hypothetical protein